MDPVLQSGFKQNFNKMDWVRRLGSEHWETCWPTQGNSWFISSLISYLSCITIISWLATLFPLFESLKYYFLRFILKYMFGIFHTRKEKFFNIVFHGYIKVKIHSCGILLDSSRCIECLYIYFLLFFIKHIYRHYIWKHVQKANVTNKMKRRE